MGSIRQFGSYNLQISVVGTAPATGAVNPTGEVQAGSDNLELGAVEIQVPSGEEVIPAVSGTGPLVKGLRGSGLLTLLVSVTTILNKPPHGVLFARHVIAYYLTLAGIFVAGVLEIGTVLWVTGGARGGGGGGGGRRAFGRVVLWASVVPLTVVSGIGGYNVVVNLLG
uniref:Uncharacterized protein n=1 Tax=Oryza nivara TaxID=4536 RepID=A0A0E0FG53_ORYNI